jgi:drug/metabolite transporter (DMT)-like permease
MVNLSKSNLGILAMISGGLLFVGNDALVKTATETMPLGELLVVRGTFAIICIIATIFAMRDQRRIREAVRRPVLIRAFFEFCVSLCYVFAISSISIGDLTTIMQATPVIMTILCALLKIETVNAVRWLTVLIGFAGVILIAQPGGSDFTIFTASALASATFVALRDLVTRKIHSDIPPTVVILTTTVFAACGGCLLGLTETWHIPSQTELSLLLGAAIIVTIANSLMVVAYRSADIGILSPLRYLVVIWAVTASYVIFGDVMTVTGTAGAILIVGSGLFNGFWDRRKLFKITRVKQ